MVAIDQAEARDGAHRIRVRRIGLGDLRLALAQGWADFLDKRGDILFIGLIYPIVGLLVAAVALNRNLLPILFPMAAGLTLLGPAVASGFYELARRRERGDDPRWSHFFDVFKSPSIGSILALTLVLALIFALWIFTAWTLYAATLGPEAPASAGAFIRDLFTTSEGWVLILVGNLVGLIFAAIVLTISVVSFPMLVDRPVDGVTAVGTSFEAVRRNPAIMAVWGLIVAGLLLLGSLPLFIGLAVVLPVLGYSTWHLYTRVVKER